MNSLIVYYSHSGNTEKIAEMIKSVVGGTIERIQPQKAYPQSYNVVVEQAKKEIRDGYLPPIHPVQSNLDEFDTIFVGSPNWWSTIAPPVATFLMENDLSGKTVVPFFTHGGGGLSGMQRDTAKLCPQSTVLNCFVVYGGGRGNLKSEIVVWLEQNGISH